MVAPGKPWVLRADLVSRDSVVDLDLLKKGFHIVTAPRPRDPDRTVLQEWDALYKHLTDHGFSTKPVEPGSVVLVAMCSPSCPVIDPTVLVYGRYSRQRFTISPISVRQ
jgi:hypothetical protein